jgi:predicted ferric reductase
MTALIKSAARSYAVWGAVLLVIGLGLLLFQNREPLGARLFGGFLWQVATGATLSALMIWQWGLLAARLSGTAIQVQRQYNWHRYAGIALIALFILHAPRFGFYWTSGLAMVFLANGLVGLLNREIIPWRRRGHYLIWYGLHVALSAILIPLSAVHIWTALAFE